MARTEPRTKKPLLWRWGFVLRTCNPPPGHVDIVSKWLVLVRACVFPLTVTSAAIGGLLAWWDSSDPLKHIHFNPWLFGLAGLGLLLAHSANNLMNDLFDLESSIDTQSYPRALYAPHPILSGLISKRGMWTAALVVNLMSLGVLVGLTAKRGWPVIAFALAGFVLSAGYAAPPLRLKKRGLGEPTVLIVWGPLMVGGTYYAATGAIPGRVIAASIPFALLATTVLMGKHIDKLPWDAPKNVGTLPVFALFALLGLPRLAQVWKAYTNPRPPEPPKGYPVWPLWYAPVAFVHSRRAGGLLLLGLLVAAVVRAI